MRLALPDCRGHHETFTLSAADRKELVRLIAEKGPGAIDEFIREREKEDSLIARKVAKLREELLRRAEELRERLRAGFAEREEQVEAEYRARLAELRSRREDLEGGLARLRGDDPAALAAALRANPVIGLALDSDAAARPPWWRRALRALVRALRVLLFPLLWLLRKLFPRRERGPDRVTMALPGAGGALARAGDLYLADARFRDAVKSRLRAAPPAERMRRAWERLLGREDYETLARRAMEAMMAEEAQRERERGAKEARSMEEALSEIVAREETARREAEEARSGLEEAARREAQALEEALRSMPEQEVKEAIVDELRAAGLLRRAGDALVPTLQFLDAFAAIVYDEEASKAGGAREGPVGDYAEGEGHHRREPLRSAMETSRMDIPASLLRARSRHPKVRHLTDDDVVVYREDRAGALRVVLVLDRSGSMETNGRMEAAKRATLALHHAVKARNRRNQVDVLLMDTSVTPATLREAWEATPRGFTNTGAALRLAREACARHKGGRTLVYLVTDGLPEAYTKGREDVAGHPEKAMAYAKQEAKLLRRERGLAGFTMLLLEPKDEMYVKAARELAEAAGGRVVPVDPGELAGALLRQFEAPAQAPAA